MQRTARLLKTEAGRPPPVGLIDPRGRARDPQAMLDACGADGYLGGTVDPDEIQAFAREVAAGEGSVRIVARSGSLLDRLLKR